MGKWLLRVLQRLALVTKDESHWLAAGRCGWTSSLLGFPAWRAGLGRLVLDLVTLAVDLDAADGGAKARALFPALAFHGGDAAGRMMLCGCGALLFGSGVLRFGDGCVAEAPANPGLAPEPMRDPGIIAYRHAEAAYWGPAPDGRLALRR